MRREMSHSTGVLAAVSLFLLLAACAVQTVAAATPLNQPPEGFTALFNGKDLAGWKGLLKGPYDNPDRRAALPPDELAQLQKEADENMRAHWSVVDGVLIFDGKGRSLCTAKDYGDFEMLVDWKIEENGDSGIYLRGSPQVQIWDTARTDAGAQVGSGGLYNNQNNPSKPSKVADKPVGEWNTFRILMVGDKVTVYLNGELVVDNVVMENYWNRFDLQKYNGRPMFPTGQIELQNHGNFLYFRNIYIREIVSAEERLAGFVPLFNGRDMTGWTGNTAGYYAQDGKIICDPKKAGGNVYTAQEYGDFIFRFEFKLTPGANNGLGIRAPLGGDAAYEGMEIQILEDSAPQYANLQPYQFHGSIYGVVPAKRGCLKPVGEWNCEEVTAKGRQITVKVNGMTIVDADLDKASTPETMDHRAHPGLKRDKGHIGFCGHGDYLEFRNIRIKSLDAQQ
ncbi:MAG TPA: DUF1080 domain-containing protein [Sedimentisphaerales bacterium]|jgi:hypothetical protein|nr:DUF1080 domain-containing protein [Sedimentisphaerales bacterium]HNU30356.1 DUF1080 domain-containing protein [Sedimentisphaerales bacterium]